MSASDVAHRFLRLFEERRIDEAAALIDDAAEWWVQGIGSAGKSEIRGAHSHIMQLTDAISFDIARTIEEGDAVAIATGVKYRFKDGKEVASEMCLLFTVANGRISSGREYMDPAMQQYFIPAHE